jgi:hypothetical protein
MVVYKFPDLSKFRVFMMARLFFGLNPYLVPLKMFCVQMTILSTPGNIVIVMNNTVKNW